MLRKILIFCLALAVKSAPAPDYYSLIETPTSRFEQKFLLSSPQLHEAYKVQPQQVRPHSEFQFPKHQPVLYYYPEYNGNQQVVQNPEHFSYKIVGDNHAPVQPQHTPQIVHYQPNLNGHAVYQQPQQSHVVHYQSPPLMNLHQVRQDTPWWQNIWNQVVNPEPEKEEMGEETDIASLLEDTSTNNANITKTESVGQSERIDSNDQFIDNSASVERSEENTTAKSEKTEFFDVRVDQAITNESEDSEAVVIDSIQRSAMPSSETEETSTESEEIVTETEKIESTTFKSTPAPETVTTTERLPLKDTKATLTKAAPKTVHQEMIYFHQPEPYRRFYIAHGPPQFYGSVDPNALIFSIQQLQPIVRTTGIKANEEEKITQFSMSPAEPSSALRIHVVDEDETREGSDDAPEQVGTRSQLPADEQSSVVLKREKEASREDKREQSVIEGESTKIHSN